jgi:hypothetical protein
MIPDRIEYLLMLARDERAENDSLIDRQNEIFTARALRLLQLQELHEETGRILQEELKRFNRWMPKGRDLPLNPNRERIVPDQGGHPTPTQQERMPKVATLGPMPQMNSGGNLATKER